MQNYPSVITVVLTVFILQFFPKATFAYKVLDMDILPECISNRTFTGVQADCNDLYHHYYADSNPSTLIATNDEKSDLKIAGYNIWNLGSSQTFYKDLKLTATMLSQWDIIGTTELLPNLGIDLSTNINLRQAIAKGIIDANDPRVKKAYRTPRYLELLFELRKLEPLSGWSLIISPYAQSLTNELVGYYYKRSKVQIIETPYCSKNLMMMKKNGSLRGKYSEQMTEHAKRNAALPTKLLGCVMPIKSTKIEDRFSRIPFLASFKSGALEFTLLTTHLLFRAPGTVFKQCGNTCLIQQKEILDETLDPQGKIVPPIRERILGNLLDGISTEETFQNEIRQISLIISRAAIRYAPRSKRGGKITLKEIDLREKFYQDILPEIGRLTSRDETEAFLETLLRQNAYFTDKEIQKLRSLATKPISAVAYLIVDSKNLKKTILKTAAIDRNILDQRFRYLLHEEKNARYYEIFVTLKTMQKIQATKRKKRKVILIGDFNLEANDHMTGKADFWNETLKALPGSALFITEKTSVSPRLENNGLANNYDHFIFNPTEIPECAPESAGGFHFFSIQNFEEVGLNADRLERYLNQDITLVDEVIDKIKSQYEITNQGQMLPYDQSEKLKKAVTTHIKRMNTTVFNSQGEPNTFFQVFRQIFSDHIPIHMTCQSNP